MNLILERLQTQIDELDRRLTAQQVQSALAQNRAATTERTATSAYLRTRDEPTDVPVPRVLFDNLAALSAVLMLAVWGWWLPVILVVAYRSTYNIARALISDRRP